MTIYDKIIQCDEEEMAEFLYRFARDTINQFGSFVMPNKENIEKLTKVINDKTFELKEKLNIDLKDKIF